MQCIFDPKMAKTAKTRIFPDTTLPFSDSKQLSPDSDQVLENVKKAKNGQKWQKLVIFRQNLENEIFSKIRLEHFLASSIYSFVQKINKI